jgi:hypothetical protein
MHFCGYRALSPASPYTLWEAGTKHGFKDTIKGGCSIQQQVNRTINNYAMLTVIATLKTLLPPWSGLPRTSRARNLLTINFSRQSVHSTPTTTTPPSRVINFVVS